jgi:hypothetical protein
VIHPDGNIWMVDVVEKLGIALARDTADQVTMPHENAEAAATHTANSCLSPRFSGRLVLI